MLPFGILTTGTEGQVAMGPTEVLVCDAVGLEALLDDLARRITAGRRAGAPLALVGIRTRGVPIAERLASRIDGAPPVGAVDITLYRDDLGEIDHWPVLHGTEIPFSVDGVDLVLVDDVLFTGRTVRAALNSICDLGRPAQIRFVALVDRGHRELPIQADAVGIAIETTWAENIKVRLRPLDPVDEIVRTVRTPAEESSR